jgi:protein SCO1/2
MNRITRRELAVAALGTLVVARQVGARPDGRKTTRGARQFPNVVLRTHENRRVRFYDDLIRGKTVLLSFMYATCEGVCPVTTANLRTVQKRLGARAGRDIFLYSITIKPKEDTPQVLRRYAAMHGAGPGWLFLTGQPDDIEFLRRRLGFVDRDPIAALDPTSHIGMILYGNDTLNRWAACPAMGNPEQIYRSVLWMEGQMPGLEGT